MWKPLFFLTLVQAIPWYVLMTKHLILGGARSGKSRYAEQLAHLCTHKQKVYVATAEALDGEMENA